jgi:hypothetical protein
MKILNIFIQCRIGSVRLPGKAFHYFFNQTIIERLIDISKKINVKNKKIFILTDKKSYKFLKPIAKKNKVNIFFGNEFNVALRFFQAIKFFNIKDNDRILRLTADNYLIQPKIIEKMFSVIKNKEFNYAYVKPLSHFAGEFFTTSFFLKEMQFPRNISQEMKEHVTYPFRRKKNKILSFDSNFMKINHKKRITLDNLRDFIYLKNLEKKYSRLKNVDCLSILRKITN